MVFVKNPSNASSSLSNTVRYCSIGIKTAILCAIGYAEADFDIAKVSVSLRSEVGSVKVCENGAGVEFSEDEAAKILAKDEIFIDIDLGQGDVSAKAWGCDLTYDYVKINGDYRS